MGKFHGEYKISGVLGEFNSTNRCQKARDGLVAYPAMSVGSVIFTGKETGMKKMMDKDNKKWLLEMY